MGSVKEIEEAVLRLSPAELAVLRAWFAELDAEAWDRRIEADIGAGRLDAFADEALDDLRAVRVGLHYRALAVERENDVVWFRVGPHAAYNRLIDPV
jgi:hypothetical protein